LPPRQTLRVAPLRFQQQRSVSTLVSWARDEAHQHVLESAIDDDLLTIHEISAVTGKK
jgi:hypothetical protein